jgi:hypothetical protein
MRTQVLSAAAKIVAGVWKIVAVEADFNFTGLFFERCVSFANLHPANHLHAAAIWQLGLVLALVHILYQELDQRRFIFRQVDTLDLGFLVFISSGHFTEFAVPQHTFPAGTGKRSARSKNPDRMHTTALWTLYLSLPQVMSRSVYFPESKRLLAVNELKSSHQI